MINLDPQEVELGEKPFPDARGTQQFFVTDIPGVGKDRYNRLLDVGFDTLNELYQASESELRAIDGIGDGTAREIKIWLGDQLVDVKSITDSEMADKSLKEISILYNISESAAEEVKERYERKSDDGWSHISE